MLARTGRSGLSSLLTIGLLILPGGIRAAAEGATPQPVAETTPSVPTSIEEAAAAETPEGYELQDVTVLTGKDAQGAEELVSAQYLGAGTRNEIRYLTFSTDQAAEAFLGTLDPDSCSPRTLTTCAKSLGNMVVAGLSASTCPHPTEEVTARASTLRDFGLGQLASFS
jgi:hypothetical protein